MYLIVFVIYPRRFGGAGEDDGDGGGPRCGDVGDAGRCCPVTGRHLRGRLRTQYRLPRHLLQETQPQEYIQQVRYC